MIYVNLEGRLGNNLWQVVAAATLAERLGTSFCAVPNRNYHCPEPDNCNFDEYIEPYKQTIFRNVKFCDKLPDNCYNYSVGYDLNDINDLPMENVRIEGYYQNIKFISEHVVQQLFAPSEQMCQELIIKYPILNEQQTCAIIVRRGDYLNLPMQFPSLDMAYYEKCMLLLNNNDCKYLVISDDAEWCQRNFIGDKFTIVENEPPIIDLYLSSLCKHQILSNSSFAQWGALLNNNPNKKVFYPDPWYGIGMRRYESHGKGMPQSWIRVKHYSSEWKRGFRLWLINGIFKALRVIN